MARLNVELVTPERKLAQHEADEVIAPGAEGLFGVRPGHAPLLSLLEAGPLSIIEGGKTTRYFVAGGFVEVGPERVRVLAEVAEALADIDPAAAKGRAADALKKLEGLSPSDAKYAAQAELVRTENVRAALASAR